MANTALCATLLLMFIIPAMLEASDEELVRPEATCIALRQVLGADPCFERTLDDLWQRSPTFRRQVARLAAVGLHVTIDQCWTACRSTLRAQTTVNYRDGALAGAKVQIRWGPADAPELIAHELEHLVEQVDGVDLVRLARTGSPGVEVDEYGRYETVRAHQIGEIVAAEYRSSAETAPACKERSS